jgi:hypothetical protein
MDSKSQESAAGERAAMLGGNMMVISWTGKSQESATDERAAMVGSNMMAGS